MCTNNVKITISDGENNGNIIRIKTLLEEKNNYTIEKYQELVEKELVVEVMTNLL